MSDFMTLLSNNFATLVLAVVTAVLAYVTYTLKKATDHLARASIMPMLVIEEVGRSDKIGNPILLNVANRGFGVAYEVRVFGTTPQGVRFQVEEHAGFLDMPPDTVTSFYVDAIGGIHMKVEVEYLNIEGYAYHGERTFLTPPILTTKGGTAS